MKRKPLKIHSVTVGAIPPKVTAGPQEHRRLSVDVENPNDVPLHVWITRRAYDYDATTGQLTLYLSDQAAPAPPAGIKLISKHPRMPTLQVVAPSSRATLDVPVPDVVRRRVPGTGLGMHFVEEPVGKIEQVTVHVQFSDEPIAAVENEHPDDQAKRLKAHGQVSRATVKPGQSRT